MGGRGGGRAGRGGDSKRPARGADLQFDMEISLEEAFKGVKTKITLPTKIPCTQCEGSGAAKGSEPILCKTCGGKGAIRSQQGFFTLERTCPSCQGAGRTIPTPCTGCHGMGRVRHDKSLAVNLPAGLDEGSRVRLAGEGESGMRGGTAGDLYISVSVKPHSLFDREGKDLHCQVPLSMVTAALGGSIEVPTIDGGRVRLVIPEGTQNGHRFRVKGKGMPTPRGGSQGDLYIHALVETPVHLSKEQKTLLQEFDVQGDGAKSNPHATNFWSKVKTFWDTLTTP